MKVSKLFCIDVEIAKRLRNIPNSSKLVNNLLQEYFENYSEKQSIFDKKRQILSKYKQKSREISKELKVFKKFESLGLDSLHINWINDRLFGAGCDLGLDDEEIRRYLFSSRNKHKKHFTLEEFKKAIQLVKENGTLFEKAY